MRASLFGECGHVRAWILQRGDFVANPNDDVVSRVVQRVFYVQVSLIISTSVLVLAAVRIDLGFYWFAFLAGVFGSSVALLRGVQKGNIALANECVRSWPNTLMPFLYGGMMATVTYFLFVSQILSGAQGQGLIATNLFPDFAALQLKEGPLRVQDWFRVRPQTINDAGKLIIWCFLGGYSESLVSGLLERLAKTTGQDEPPAGENSQENA